MRLRCTTEATRLVLGPPACCALQTLAYMAALVRAVCRNHPVAEVMLVLWAIGHLIEGAAGFGTGPAMLPREATGLPRGRCMKHSLMLCAKHFTARCMDVSVDASSTAGPAASKSSVLRDASLEVSAAYAPPMLLSHRLPPATAMPQRSWRRWAMRPSSRWCAC